MKKATEPLTGVLLLEHRTIMAMTRIYCRDHHKNTHKIDKLCHECQAFVEFAGFRLSKCPYGQVKPVCQHCPIHCYKKDMKEMARVIMRYSGPRMLLKHPILAIRHLWHGRKPIPDLPRKRKPRN